MFVMSKVSVCLSLFRFTVVIIIIALLLLVRKLELKKKFQNFLGRRSPSKEPLQWE